ncbi:EAL domain, c-di-GMP-specific phosphodiesterase class I (or its enzymatically inactive variant) [Geodermatophilus saharensis]|uniref:EAL domain, c-di-GMP-specific phosphodiesterase class I (Or its enzymatically inactive variant) n=1 Tax=Geodermatophilus saharensis TaxID=1137994 RepID=A0A239IFX8_9ACTN|nr:EAL domain, c-di-GMP-specific phosphodiesterase class I (or its enzymatically inactive variant) [Geodermatophilus saharensis]
MHDLCTGVRTVSPPATTGPTSWAAELDRLLARPETLRLVFQPIVDVARGVVAGYETLARFTDADGGPSAATPDRWFAAADAAGIGARVEALVIERCLRLRESLPPDCFLTVNVSPHLLPEPELAELLLGAGDLAPLVLELTEHQDVADVRPLLDLRDRLLDRGALVAVDDAGSGYSGLQQLTAVRPQMIKLDRALVAGADTDEVKLALASCSASSAATDRPPTHTPEVPRCRASPAATSSPAAAARSPPPTRAASSPRWRPTPRPTTA